MPALTLWALLVSGSSAASVRPPIAAILSQPAQLPLSGYAKPVPIDAFDLLVGSLHSQNKDVRKQSIAELGVFGDIRAVPYLGTVLLQIDEEPEIRVAAAMALGRVRNWRAATFLRQSLRDWSREVRFASALAFGQSKSRDCVPLLALTLKSDADWWVRFAAATALGNNLDPKAAISLAEAAGDDARWEVRMQAVRSLGQIGSLDAVRALDKNLRDPDPSVRAAAATALTDIGGANALSELANALHDESEEFPRRVISDGIAKLLGQP